LGWSFTYFGNYNSYYSNYYNVQNTRVFSCYAGSNQYCTISYYPTFLYQSYSIPCFSYGNSYCYVTLPGTIYPNNNYYPYFYSDYVAIGRWLFYAVGHTAVAAPLNIAWGAITLNLIGTLTITTSAVFADDSRAKEVNLGENGPVLAKGTVPTFLVGYGRSGLA